MQGQEKEPALLEQVVLAPQWVREEFWNLESWGTRCLVYLPPKLVLFTPKRICTYPKKLL